MSHFDRGRFLLKNPVKTQVGFYTFRMFRCGGCCSHPLLTCNPTEFRTEVKQVILIGEVKQVILIIGDIKQVILIGEVKQVILIGEVKQVILIGEVKQVILIGEVRQVILLYEIRVNLSRPYLFRFGHWTG